MSRLRLGLIGCGGRGRYHLRKIEDYDDVSIIAACDPVEASLGKAVEEFQIGRQYGEIDDLLDNEQLDAIIVATPAHLNHVAALPCLQRGLPVLLEKPPGLSLEETVQLRDAAAESGAQCMVGWNRRFDPFINEACSRIKGPMTQIVGEFHKSMKQALGSFPERLLDRLLLETPIHALDAIRSIAKSEVKEVHSFARRSCSDYRDVHSALILFENGCVANLIANYTTDARLERYEIHGWWISAYLEGVNQGAIVCDGQRHEMTCSGDSTQAQNRHFLDCVKEDRPITLPAANLDEAIKTMDLAQSILDSVVP